MPSHEPPRAAYSEFPVYTAAEFDSVGIVKSAIAEHDFGNFRGSGQLVDAMMRDDRIYGVSATRLTSLLKFPLEFNPRGDGRRSRSIAAEVKESWRQFMPTDQMIELMKWQQFMGIGLAEMTWKLDSKRWTPTVKVWHPMYMYWRWDTFSYWVTAIEGLVEVHPGDGRWLLYAPNGMKRGWIWGKLRALSIPWLIRQWDWRDWARHSEVHGQPGRIAYMPATADERAKAKFTQQVAALGVESVIRAEYGADGAVKWDVKLLEAVANEWEGFQKLIGQADTAIAVVWLGQNLTTEAGSSSQCGGSRAAAQVQDRVRDDLTEWDATSFAPFCQEQILAPWAWYNFGDRDLAPEPVWMVHPPEDLDKKSKVFLSVAQGLASFQAAGALDAVDLDGLLDEFEIPHKELEAGDDAEAAYDAEPEIEPGIPQPQLDPVSPLYQPTTVGTPTTDPTSRQRPVKQLALPWSEELKKKLRLPHGKEKNRMILKPGKKKKKREKKAPIEKPIDKRHQPDDEVRRRLSRALEAGASLASIRGMLFSDDLAAQSSEHATRVLAPKVHRMLTAIAASTSYDELRRNLRTAYKLENETELQELMAKAIVLAQLAGHKAVWEN